MELTYIRGVLLIITSSVIAFLLCNSSIVFQAEISFWVLSVLLANNKYTNRKIFAIGTINTNNYRPDNEISRNLFIHCARKYHNVMRIITVVINRMIPPQKLNEGVVPVL